MIIYKVARGTPYTLVRIDAEGKVLYTSREQTKYENMFSVEDIIIDPILLSNDPHKFDDYDPQLIKLAKNGYIVVGSSAIGYFLMAVRYENAVVWG